jgi:hypothetical protein
VRVCAALLAAALFAICGLPRRAAASPSDGTRSLSDLRAPPLGAAASQVRQAPSVADASDTESIAAATRSDAAPEAGQVVLYLARRSWHVDVGFAVRDLRPSLAFSARRFPQAKYLFFGFGDRHYLMSKRKGTSTLAGALFPGRGLILVTAIENSPAQAFGGPHVLEFALSAPQTAAAQHFVRRALAGGGGSSPRGEDGNTGGESGNTSGESGNANGESGNTSGESGNANGESGNTSGESGNANGEGENANANGEGANAEGGNANGEGGNDGVGDIPALADGPYEGSVYYSAVARYSALHTCNTWAAEVLKSAALSVHTHFVLFAGQIWNQARKLNTTQAIPPPTTLAPTALVAPTALAPTALVAPTALAPTSRAPDSLVAPRRH